MKKVTITVDDDLYDFFKKIGDHAGGKKPEQVMADMLFQLVGELSLELLKRKN